MAYIVGYFRVSTRDQQAGFAAQERDLKAAGAQKVFSEKASAKGGNHRPQLDAAIEYLRPGDVLTVTKLDRLARSIADLCKILERIEAKEASLRVLNLNLDTATPTGKLMLNMLGAIAQFEREMMLERQVEGIAKAKAEGKFTGRPKTVDDDAVRAALDTGLTAKQVAAKLGIGERSVYKVKAASRAA